MIKKNTGLPQYPGIAPSFLPNTQRANAKTRKRPNVPISYKSITAPVTNSHALLTLSPKSTCPQALEGLK